MTLHIAVHISSQEYPDSYAPGWIDALEKYGVTIHKVDLCTTNAIEEVKACDGVMWHWFHTPEDKQTALKILPAIEYGLGIPVFPNMRTCWHYDEKTAQHYLLQASDAKSIQSWVFYDYREAQKFIKNCNFPIIFKLSVGAGSANVLQVKNYKDAKHLLNRMFNEGIFPYTMNEFEKIPRLRSLTDFKKMVQRLVCALKYILSETYPPLEGYYLPQKNYVYLQEFLPGNHYDIRITIIGNRGFGFIRYNRENDFRASGSGLIDYDPNNIPLDAVKIAHELSIKNNFQSMAYDFLLDREKKPLINEISYCYLSKAVQMCPGYWDRDLIWHQGHVCPEEAHVEDFIEVISGRLD
jgi:glutathione synthase/RimK-type ligase-like ATP-grasp enzyme